MIALSLPSHNMTPMRNVWILFACGILLRLDRIVEAGPREPPVVTLPDHGQLKGIYLTMLRIQRIVGYMGIPYALPPTGDRRFQPPVVDNLPRWEGVRNASELQPECWADHRKAVKHHEEAFARLIGTPKKWNSDLYDEDCLYLNVYTPDGEWQL